MDLFELSAKIELDTDEYEKSVKDASKTAEKVEDSLKDAGKAADKTEDSLDDLGDTAKKTSKETDGLGKSTKKTKESIFESVLKADLFSNALSKMGEIAVEAAQYIWELDEATEEYRASQAKLNTAFKVSGFSADTAKEAFRGLYRVVGDIDQATEASQLMSQLALTTEDISKWTTIATGVYGTFGDSLPIESLIESANETARVGQVTGTLADALNWAGQVGEDEFNTMLADCKTQEDRVKLITETLMGTYEDAAGVFEETSGSVMEARDAFIRVSEAEAEAGKEIEKMKNSFEKSTQFAKKGFLDTIASLAEGMTGFSEACGAGTDAQLDFLDAMNQKIETGSIDDAVDAYAKLKYILDEFKKNPLGMAALYGGSSGLFGGIGFKHELEDLLFMAEERIGGVGDASESTALAERQAAAATEELDASMLPIIATAGGLSVQIEGTGLTAEEASSRLQTYTDAATNMFEKISTESELSYADAVENLRANVQATQDFAANMASLAGALPPQLAEMFAAGGPSMYAGVVAMLAEANAGSDVGLSELNSAFSEGGTAAMEAFITSLGAVPADVQTPATIIAEQIEADTSMETAATAAVERTNTAMQNAVTSAGFDQPGRDSINRFITGMESMRPRVRSKCFSIANSAVSALRKSASGSGSYLMSTFISGMEGMRGSVMSTASSIAEAAKSRINSALSGVGQSGSGRAGGLDFVPYNGYPAVLHAGEAVLTAREAKEWRAGNSTTNNKLNLGGVNINVYGAQHQDERAIAEAIADQLQKLVNRKEAVFGNA